MSEQELLMRVGQLSDPRSPLTSPGELVRKGREFVARNMGAIREKVCGNRDLVDLPEAELASAIMGVALQNVAFGLAAATATYAAKRGLKWICGQQADDA
jgi:hypothetical protein